MKRGFTLAEVLVTLGVIGVVAAMTLPTLIQNYRNHVAETRLKKFYSTFNQAIQRSVVENGDTNTWDMFMGGSAVDNKGNYANNIEQVEENYEKYLGKYIKTVNKKKISTSTAGKNIIYLTYYLPDGSAFAFPQNTDRDIYYFISNPEKCLQKDTVEQRGKCMFEFEFYPKNKAYEWKYLYRKGLEPYYYSWDGKMQTLHNDTSYGCKDGGGHYCTAIIQQNNWKIPKDYPRKIMF